MAPEADRAAESPLEAWVERAQAGDRDALERVVTAIQGDVHRLALRFLWSPQNAEDAVQEILVRVVTRLGSFEGRSSFRTWVYRVATNALLNMKPTAMERQAVSFEAFGEDLARGLSDAPVSAPPGVEESLLLEEVKIGCTHALLHCLDRDQRVAFILGEILEMDQAEACEVLEISPAAYRKRLSRARRRLTSFMAGHCGLFDPANPCRCRRRADRAVELGRVDPHDLRFAVSAAHARRFPAVLAEIRKLDEAQRTAALYRSHPDPEVRADFVPRLRRMLVRSSWRSAGRRPRRGAGTGRS